MCFDCIPAKDAPNGVVKVEQNLIGSGFIQLLQCPEASVMHFHQCYLPAVHLAHGNGHCAVRKDQRHCSS